MFRLTLFCFCIALVLATPTLKKPSKVAPRKLPGPRIIGGEAARPGEFPYQAALFIEDWFCGGSIINEEWILTAGHCVEGASGGQVVTGSISPFDGQVTDIAELILHEEYDPETLENDIGLIRLAEPLRLGGEVEAIQLDPQRLAEGEEVIVSGWGVTSDDSGDISEVLNYVDLVSITNEECEEAYGGDISDGVVCLAYSGNEIKNSCSGDSGGPVVIRRGGGAVQVAIVSFGPDSGCENDVPGGYTRVSTYESWIQSHIRPGPA